MRRAILCTTAFFLSVFASCTIPTQVEIFNDSEQLIRIVTEGNEVEIPPGKIAKLGYEGNLNQIEIQIGLVEHTYRLRSGIPNDFVQWRGWGPWSERVARIQLDSEGRIWLVGRDQTTPVQKYITQPDGFPLVPHAV
jgi:hypothetical protein